MLLLDRYKNGMSYCVFPGGGIKRGETPEQAAIREAKEETGLKVELDRKLWILSNKEHQGHFYFVKKFTGKLGLGDPELKRATKNNIYSLKWIKIKDVKKICLYPNIAKKKFLEELSK